MKKLTLTRYSTPKMKLVAIQKEYLKEHKNGLLLDMSDLPEDYEVVIRSIVDKHKGEQIIYQNLEE